MVDPSFQFRARGYVRYNQLHRRVTKTYHQSRDHSLCKDGPPTFPCNLFECIMSSSVSKDSEEL